MKVTNIQAVVKPDYKEEYLTMSTGHVATLVQFNDGTGLGRTLTTFFSYFEGNPQGGFIKPDP